MAAPAIIRRAIAADAGAVARVHVRSWRAGYRGLLSGEELAGPSEAQRDTMWQGLLEQEGRPTVFVAEVDDAIMGFCAVATPSHDADAGHDVAEIVALYVDPVAWRTGVGRALLREAVGLLRDGPWREMTLWVMSDNERAHHFYGQFGWVADGRQRSDRAGTEVRLRASLEP